MWENSSLSPPLPSVSPSTTIEWPSAFVPHELQRYSGLTSSADIMSLQAAADAEASARAKRSSLAGMTPRILAEDMREALVGIPLDVWNGSSSLYDVLVRRDRLRGLGLLVCLLSLAWFLLVA